MVRAKYFLGYMNKMAESSESDVDVENSIIKIQKGKKRKQNVSKNGVMNRSSS